MEIERKFLLNSLPELDGAYRYRIEQAYIETAPRDIIQFKYAENLQI